MIGTMLYTAFLAVSGRLRIHDGSVGSSSRVGEVAAGLPTDSSVQRYLRRLAVPQAILAVLALSNFHVQIVNRISSGYPLWYLAVAAMTADRAPVHLFKDSSVRSETVVRLMIMYAIVQTGLFASFLPPA